MKEPSEPPLWRSISDQLRERVRTVHYSDNFPGELEVAAEVSVSRGTARDALRDAGLITASRGRRPQITQREPRSQYGAI